MNGLAQFLPSVPWVKEQSQATRSINPDIQAYRETAATFYEQVYEAYSTDTTEKFLRSWQHATPWPALNAVSYTQERIVNNQWHVFSAEKFANQYPVRAQRTILTPFSSGTTPSWVRIISTAVAPVHMVIFITPNTTVTTPIDIATLCKEIGSVSPIMRVSIIVDDHAHVCFEENWETLFVEKQLQLISVTFWVGNHARVTYTVFGPPYTGTLFTDYTAILGTNATYTMDYATGVTAQALTYIHTICEGTGSEATIHGGMVMHSSHKTLLHIHQEHSAPHSSSNVRVHGILSNHAHTIYSGKITIHPGCAGANARQMHKSMLLGTHARSDAMPILQVKHHAVQCGHGSAVGMIDAMQIWYMQTRGLSSHAAKALLLEAFFASMPTIVTKETIAPLIAQCLAE